VIIEIEPPVSAVASPALTETRPPADNFPLPTTMLTLPPAPLVADPVRRVIIPLLAPVTTFPVIRERDPDAPDGASAVLMLNDPLDVAEP
jgi:hypothetical protein